MKSDQPIGQCNHVLRVAHCSECGPRTITGQAARDLLDETKVCSREELGRRAKAAAERLCKLGLCKCPECPNKPQPVEPRGDTSGRRQWKAPATWPDMHSYVWGMNGMTIRLRDGTEWLRDYGLGREWVCIRGPR